MFIKTKKDVEYFQNDFKKCNSAKFILLIIFLCSYDLSEY